MEPTRKNQSDSLKGMFWGLVIGDCLGSPIQFSTKDGHPTIADMVPCKIFDTPAGYWTDDSSMAFCIAESHVACGGTDVKDIADRFVRWLKKGYWSSLPHAFDVGHATSQSLHRYASTGSLRNGEESSQGNGSIMRFAPNYIATLAETPERARELRHAVSDITHNSAKVRATVDKFSAVLDDCVAGRKPVASRYATRDEVDNSGWAVSSLEAALWAFHATASFEEAVLAAVNLGGDSDTIGAICGQIAGAYYGFSAIPSRWITAVKNHAKVNDLIEATVNKACSGR